MRTSSCGVNGQPEHRATKGPHFNILLTDFVGMFNKRYDVGIAFFCSQNRTLSPSEMICVTGAKNVLWRGHTMSIPCSGFKA